MTENKVKCKLNALNEYCSKHNMNAFWVDEMILSDLEKVSEFHIERWQMIYGEAVF